MASTDIVPATRSNSATAAKWRQLLVLDTAQRPAPPAIGHQASCGDVRTTRERAEVAQHRRERSGASDAAASGLTARLLALRIAPTGQSNFRRH